jgi:heme exporter protein A
MRLVAEGLSGERGGHTVFSGVDFALGPGESLTVMGPNGSGKSTLLRVVAGLLPIASGAVRMEGGGEDFPTIASACHYLGHDNAMKTALTVSENLGFWRNFCGLPNLTVVEALEKIGLETIGHLPFGYLSAGQRRRTAIAKLLVTRRPIWLLDEPTAGLDAASDAAFVGVMKAHCEDGGIVVAATHLPLGLDARLLKLGDATAPSSSPREG